MNRSDDDSITHALGETEVGDAHVAVRVEEEVLGLLTPCGKRECDGDRCTLHTYIRIHKHKHIHIHKYVQKRALRSRYTMSCLCNACCQVGGR